MTSYDSNLLASAPAATKEQLQHGYTTDLLEKPAPSPSQSRHDLEAGGTAADGRGTDFQDSHPPPPAKIPFYRTTKGIVIIVVALIVVIAAAVGGGVGGSKKKSNDTSSSSSQQDGSAPVGGGNSVGVASAASSASGPTHTITGTGSVATTLTLAQTTIVTEQPAGSATPTPATGGVVSVPDPFTSVTAGAPGA